MEFRKDEKAKLGRDKWRDKDLKIKDEWESLKELLRMKVLIGLDFRFMEVMML